ncbi:MAG TPA: DUF1992 domain-containing protein [Pyrinomonadaceae bacterium]|jgi:hypothetical protein|nr:DUF1992 domain-containing protein [Pyrinomonadaceae bacterium]
MNDEVRGIEQLIRAAIARGEFDDLPGKGQPLDLDSYFQSPDHLRMGHSILKNGGFVPEEVQLLKDMESLREELKTCPDEARQKDLGRALQEKSLSYSLLMERARRTRR